MKKRIYAMTICLILLVTSVGCGSKKVTETPTVEEESTSVEEEVGGMIGIAMPSTQLKRWNKDGEELKNSLITAGYEVDLQYAEGDTNTQISQINAMISEGCKVLIISAIDGTALNEPLSKAEEQEIPVIAYDRLLMNSEAVSYYATFDNEKIGAEQAEYIRDALDLDNQPGPFNIELFAGDSVDNNAKFYYKGAMEVLQPYMDAGKLVIPSGQVTFENVATSEWSATNAEARMNQLLSAYYSDGQKLDAVLCSNDSAALGVSKSLIGAYTGAYPILTGQDCDAANIKNMLGDRQSMDVFKDTRALAAQVAVMADSIVKGEKVETNDNTSYDNGVGIINTYLCEHEICTRDNYEKLLVESGYYTADELK